MRGRPYIQEVQKRMKGFGPVSGGTEGGATLKK